MKVGFGKKAKKGLTGKAGKKGRRDKKAAGKKAKEAEKADTVEKTDEEIEKDIVGLMDTDEAKPEAAAPKAGMSKKARKKLQMEQKSMLKSKGLILKKSKMQDKKCMQRGIQGTTNTTTNALTVAAMKMASDRLASNAQPVSADIEMQA